MTTTPELTELTEKTPAPAGGSTVALVTGANKGIGRETVRRLLALGWTVWLGARDAERGNRAVEELADAQPGADVRLVQLDVTSDVSVSDAVARIEEASGRLDVLVNNAGIGGGFVGPRDATPADFVTVYGVNLLGPVRVTHAFLPLLDRSERPRVVMVSSGMGSFGVTTDPDRIESTLHSPVYQSSKAALNMVTSQLAKELDRYQVTAVDPGYTATDLNGHGGPQTVQEGAEPVVLAATLPPGAPTGRFVDRHGPLPW